MDPGDIGTLHALFAHISKGRHHAEHFFCGHGNDGGAERGHAMTDQRQTHLCQRFLTCLRVGGIKGTDPVDMAVNKAGHGIAIGKIINLKSFLQQRKCGGAAGTDDPVLLAENTARGDPLHRSQCVIGQKKFAALCHKFLLGVLPVSVFPA